jgi:hypothetical protein
MGRSETFIAHPAPFAAKPAIIGGGKVGSAKVPAATPSNSGAASISQ